MRKILTIAVLFLVLSSTTVLSNAINIDLSKNDIDDKDTEDSIGLKVLVIAFPKIARAGKSIYFLVLWPMFLVNGLIHYDFDDGTFQDTNNFARHKFLIPGDYTIDLEFDTILGIKATGMKKVYII